MRAALGRYQAIPDAEWRFFRERVRPGRYAKGESLVTLAQPPGRFHYIVSGLVKLAYAGDGERLLIKAFAREGEMTGPLLAWTAGEPSPLEIVALEPTHTLHFPAALVPALYRRDPLWERVVRGHVDALARRGERRARELLELTPERRYLAFLEASPALAERLPLHLIAAYIGVTDVTLSRIRRRLRGER